MVDAVANPPYGCLPLIGAFAFAHVSALPTATAEGLIADLGLPSPVDKIIRAAEWIWGVGVADLAEPHRAAAATLCAQLADAAQSQGWHVLGSTDRAARMIGACRRILGEDGADQDPADDPAPLGDYVPPDE